MAKTTFSHIHQSSYLNTARDFFEKKMTTAISLDYGISNPQTCRVEVQPSTVATGFNTVMKGGQKYTTPSGITYRINGMTITQPDKGLRMPQMRSFLAPEYYNSGCSSLYCKDAQMCPSSVTIQSDHENNDMMNFLFESHSDFTGNDAPPQCFAGGDKYSGYNSVRGWQTSGLSSQMQWQSGSVQGGCSN